jgi:recombination associated protein RdgC
MEARRRLVEATETITAPTAPLPQRKAIKPTSRAQSAARVIVEAMSGLRAVDVRGAADWSHDQDFQLLRLTADPQDLDARLESAASRPLSSVEERGAGWARVDPVRWSATVNGATLLALEVSRKPIPADAVKREVAARSARWAEKMGKPPTKPERGAIKDGVHAEFVQRIPARVKTIRAYIDTAAGVLVVDTASDKAAEEVIKALREVVPGFACEPIRAQACPENVLHSILTGQKVPPFVRGDRVTFASEESTASFSGVDLTRPLESEVVECLHLPVTRIGLSLGGQSFVLDDSLRVRGYRAEDQAETDGDAPAELDARLALLSGNVRELLDALHTAFGWRS